MTRHNDVNTSPVVVAKAIPVLAKHTSLIGDPAVRHMGTIGGSVANIDPNADYPAARLALGATIITNKRRIKADDFFTGMFDRAGAGRDHRQGELPDPEEGRLPEIWTRRRASRWSAA